MMYFEGDSHEKSVSHLFCYKPGGCVTTTQLTEIEIVVYSINFFKAPTMTYSVVYCRGYKLPREGDYTVVAANLPTIEDAAKCRKVSGDLVIEDSTKRIVQSNEWLWDWERTYFGVPAASYARMMMEKDA
jgi:hypothetical protein